MKKQIKRKLELLYGKNLNEAEMRQIEESDFYKRMKDNEKKDNFEE